MSVPPLMRGKEGMRGWGSPCGHPRRHRRQELVMMLLLNELRDSQKEKNVTGVGVGGENKYLKREQRSTVQLRFNDLSQCQPERSASKQSCGRKAPYKLRSICIVPIDIGSGAYSESCSLEHALCDVWRRSEEQATLLHSSDREIKGSLHRGYTLMSEELKS